MKKMIGLVIISICVLVLISCSAETKTFEIVGAEKLTVQSGTTGKRIDITNIADIRYITDNISALEYSKGKKVKSEGWSYRLQWFDINGEIIEELTLYGDERTINYKGYYYKGITDDCKIDLKFLESQFVK